MTVGILHHAHYLPRLRVEAAQYKAAWSVGLPGGRAKVVADIDEDTLTMAVEAAQRALDGLDPAQIDLLCLASTQWPYGYRMVAATLVEALGLRPAVFCTEHSQSARSGTEALIAARVMLQSGSFERALVIAADDPQAEKGSALERGFGAAAVAFLLGPGKAMAVVEEHASYAHEALGERFREPDSPSIHDLGIRAYRRDIVKHTIGASVSPLLSSLGRVAADYAHVAGQQTDDASGALAGLGFTAAQTEATAGPATAGDTGAVSPLLGLSQALNVAGPGEHILVVSYAPGAGSDAISLRTCEALPARRRAVLAEANQTIDYVAYLKIREALK